MAELDVQPKKNTWWRWALLTIFALALLFYIVRGCRYNTGKPVMTGGDSTSIGSAHPQK